MPPKQQKRQSKAAAAPPLPWPWLLAFGAIILITIARLQLLGIPLERDEGEYAYAGQLLLEGIPPYELAYNMKLPGTYAAYAIMMALFGQTVSGVHLGLAAANALTMFFVFLLGRALFDNRVGALACLSFGLMALSPNVLGTAGHATQFVVLFAVPGLLVFWKALERDKLPLFLISGLLLGCAFLMKQQAAFFGLLAGTWLVYTQLQRTPRAWMRLGLQCGALLGGSILPFALTCLVLWKAGVFPKFWFWTFTYAANYATALPLPVGWEQFVLRISETSQGFIPLYLLGFASLLLLWRTHRERAHFMILFVALSFAATAVGLYFREHYFVLMLPAVCLGIGVTVVASFDLLARHKENAALRWIPVAAFCLIFGSASWMHYRYFANQTDDELARKLYPANPFVESREVAKFLGEASSKNEKIAVVGSEPQIYFLSQRRSATGYIYTYALMEDHEHAAEMQQEFIREIETAMPEYLVFVGFNYSWLIGPNSNRAVFDWFDHFSKEHYERVGVAHLLAPGQTEYRWNEDARDYEAQTSSYIYVFKRKLSS